MPRCNSCHRLIPGGSCPHDGWTAPLASDPPSERVTRPEVPGYHLGEPLGAGGFAVVWAATRDRDGAALTIKVGRTETPVLAERFRREAEAMRLVGPPSTPELHEHGRLADGRPFIVMERLLGETLAELLMRRPDPPPLAEVARLGDALLDALMAAHARDVIHRDVKPDNIFLADAGARVALLDFGLVRRAEAVEAELTRSGVAVGTPEYMAPEQIRAARGVGAQADIYSIGVTLFEIVTLRVPFVGERSSIEHGHVALRPPRPSDFAPVPPALEELILACLAKQPERRPAGAAALRRALAAACAAPAIEPPEPSQPRACPRGACGARLLGEGKHPVVLAAIECDGDAAALRASITGRRGFIARQRGRRSVAVFSGLDVEDPTRAAVAAVREVVAVEPGARGALHLASVSLRRKEGGLRTAYGPEIERPEDWLPPEPWSGVHITSALTATLPEPAPPRAPDADMGDVPMDLAGPAIFTSPSHTDGMTAERSSESRARIPPLGRGDVLERLGASLRAPFEQARPALFTLLGDPGLGKTCLAVEAAALAQAARPEALIVSLWAEASVAGARSTLIRDLLTALGDSGRGAALPDRAREIAEALQRRARRGPVAVILDDAQWAESEVLEALEYATLDGADLPLWVVVAASPRLERLRPGWGDRTRHRDRVTLDPLPQPAAAALAAELLRPAEYIPQAALERLARWSAGNPAALAEVARSLKRAGAVRRRPNTTSYYLATAAVEALPASPAWQWLAARRLGAIAPELAACLRLCAVLGAAFSRDEVEHIQDALERAGLAATPVDAGFGLSALAEEGLLERGAGAHFSFHGKPLQEAVYELVEPAQRARIHELALGYWRARAGEEASVEALERLARHAAACGRREEAADAHLALGAIALGKHRAVEADLHYTAALEQAHGEDTRRRAAALSGRGRCRYRIGRAREAVEDLAGARALHERAGDNERAAEALLEQATALDWQRQFEASARCVEEARPLVKMARTPRLSLQLMVAEGRTLYRTWDVPRSIDVLRSACSTARELGDYENRVVALLILSLELAVANELGEAEERFDEVIRITADAQDINHLAAAYTNRFVFWYMRKEVDRALDDMRRAIALSRTSGNPRLEHIVSLVSVEFLFQFDRDEEALALAHRTRLLEDRFSERPAAQGTIMLARILLTLGKLDEALQVMRALDSIESPELTEASEVRDKLKVLTWMLKLVRLELERSEADDLRASEWNALLHFAEQQEDEFFLEVVYWCVYTSLGSRRAAEASLTLDRARARRERSDKWRTRLAALERTLERGRS